MPDWDHEEALDARRIRRTIAAQDEIDMRTGSAGKPFTIPLPGGVTLTAEGALLALYEAFPIVKDSSSRAPADSAAKMWIETYFPNYEC